MNNEYGLIENGVCVNVVVADADWAGLLEGEWILSTPTNVAWIGATVTDGIFQVIPKHVFVAPAIEEQPNETV